MNMGSILQRLIFLHWQEFFPNVNLRKLYEVEKYHQKLAVILDKQFAEERSAVTTQIAVLQEQLAQIKQQIADMGYIGDLSKEFLDRHAETRGASMHSVRRMKPIGRWLICRNLRKSPIVF